MNGFLILGEFPIDQVPLGLYPTLTEAERHFRDDPSALKLNLYSDSTARDPENVMVVEFVEGKPVSLESYVLDDQGRFREE